MSSAEITDSPRVQIVRSFCEAFQNRDIDRIAKLLHKDHRRTTYPRSVGVPERTGEEYLQHTAKVMSLWIDNQPTIHSIIEAPGGKVVTHLTSLIKTSIGVDLDREMILVAQVVTDEDGSLKIKESEEFTDSKAYLDFFKATAAAKADGQNQPSLVA